MKNQPLIILLAVVALAFVAGALTVAGVLLGHIRLPGF